MNNNLKYMSSGTLILLYLYNLHAKVDLFDILALRNVLDTMLWTCFPQNACNNIIIVILNKFETTVCTLS